MYSCSYTWQLPHHCPRRQLSNRQGSTTTITTLRLLPQAYRGMKIPWFPKMMIRMPLQAQTLPVLSPSGCQARTWKKVSINYQHLCTSVNACGTGRVDGCYKFLFFSYFWLFMDGWYSFYIYVYNREACWSGPRIWHSEIQGKVYNFTSYSQEFFYLYHAQY